jgi:hypothetical protein
MISGIRQLVMSPCEPRPLVDDLVNDRIAFAAGPRSPEDGHLSCGNCLYFFA